MTQSSSLTGKQWQTDTAFRCGTAAECADQLAEQRGLPRPLQSSSFALTSPHVYPDMHKAVERIARAVQERQKIGIFGDYDCDGITSTAQLVRYFRSEGIEPIVRLPHRVRDGYGLSAPIVEEWKAHSVSLVITVDTGIASVQEVNALQSSGIDVIITDHHHLQQETPSAFAIIHPACAEGYPEPYPSGAGVVFSLLRGLRGNQWQDIETDAALAMMGTVADLVPLRGDNRTLVQWGLHSLNRLQAGPLVTLRMHSGLEEAVTSTDVAFRLAPRINAAGRLDDPLLALDALLDGGDAVEKLCLLNKQRQEETDHLYVLALEQYRIDLQDTLITCVDTVFHPGIVGLLAGRLTEQTGKPSMVCAVADGICTASLRSVPAYNIADGLERIGDMLLTFGGHAQAAGCTCTMSNLPEIQSALAEDIRSRTRREDLLPSIMIDAILGPNDVTEELCDEIETLQPFGAGNSEPLFLIEHVILENLRTVGRDAAHLQAKIGNVQCVAFGLGAHASMLTDKQVDIACTIEKNTWQGQTRPQLIVRDIRLS